MIVGDIYVLSLYMLHARNKMCVLDGMMTLFFYIFLIQCS